MDRQINNIEQKQLRIRFNPDGSLLRKHQLRMLEMLKYIDKICKKYDIKYWLSSGTLLGAVRHGGFIPWDDDVDIEMLREDYKKFVRALKEENPSDYILQTHQTDFNYLAPYGKLRDLHSYIKEDNYNDWYYKYQGIYIDVFIMDPSSSLFLNKVGNYLQHFCLFQMNKYISNIFFRKISFGFVFFLVHKIIFPFLSGISRINSRGQLRHTMGSWFTKPRYKEDIFPLSQMKFERIDFPVPYDYDNYLKKIYGDYMSLPELDRVNLHTISVKFN